MTAPAIPEREVQFQKWYASWANKLGLNPNPDDPRHFYDYRAAFRAGAKPDSTGHWPSTYKREGHPNLYIHGMDTRTGKPMTPPIPPRQLPDADLWEYYRARGLSPEEATLHVERRRSAQRPTKPPPLPSKGQAALAGAAQGATSGFADEIVGAIMAARDPNTPFTSAGIGGQIDQVREAMGAARFSHPVVAGVSNVAGSLINPLARLLPAPTNALRGAVTGGALGAVQGVGEAGGSLGERLPMGAVGAGAGAVAGAAAGKFVIGPLDRLLKKMTPVARNAWMGALRIARGKKLPTAQAQVAAAEAAEAAVRASLVKAKQPPEVIERVIQAMRAGNQLPSTAPPTPTALRPGETITPIASTNVHADLGYQAKALAIEGSPPPLPQGPFPPSLPEMQGFSSTSRATPKPISVGTIPPGSSLEEVQASNAFNSRLRGPLNARRMALEELFQASAEGESGLPQSLVSALKQIDDLGFDTPENAIAAILQHADWRTRWDVMQPANKVAVQTIANWKAQVLGYGGHAAKALPDIGQGKTLPYYPRGGGVEQAFGAPPVSTAAQGINPNQLQPYIDFLRANGPQGFPAQAQALRSLGVPLPPTADAELARLLFGGS